MAKKSSRILFGLVCETCGSQNYISEWNKINSKPDKWSKFCAQCDKHTPHKEKKKLG